MRIKAMVVLTTVMVALISIGTTQAQNVKTFGSNQNPIKSASGAHQPA